jgi:hypothetical protein
MDPNAYQRYCRDYKATRQTYLKRLADEYHYEYKKLSLVADLLGPTEDFKGLVSHLKSLKVWE